MGFLFWGPFYKITPLPSSLRMHISPCRVILGAITSLWKSNNIVEKLFFFFRENHNFLICIVNRGLTDGVGYILGER